MPVNRAAEPRRKLGNRIREHSESAAGPLNKPSITKDGKALVPARPTRVGTVALMRNTLGQAPTAVGLVGFFRAEDTGDVATALLYSHLGLVVVLQLCVGPNSSGSIYLERNG